MLGIQFYRQRPIGPYIVDLYAPAVNLVIEADGSQHFEENHREYDAIRDVFLAENGLEVFQFTNQQILTETNAVLETIYHLCSERRVDSSLQQNLNPPKSPFFKGGPYIP